MVCKGSVGNSLAAAGEAVPMAQRAISRCRLVCQTGFPYSLCSESQQYIGLRPIGTAHSATLVHAARVNSRPFPTRGPHFTLQQEPRPRVPEPCRACRDGRTALSRRGAIEMRQPRTKVRDAEEETLARVTVTAGAFETVVSATCSVRMRPCSCQRHMPSGWKIAIPANVAL